MAESTATAQQPKKSHTKVLVLVIVIAVILMIFVPLLTMKGAEFSGSDDAGSDMVEEVSPGYERWATPVLEQIIGGELPSEMESLLFCVQTGIGVGVIFYCLGYMVARKKFATPQQLAGDEGLGLDEIDEDAVDAQDTKDGRKTSA